MQKSLLIIVFLVFASLGSLGQITLKAIITSSDGTPFPGVTVSIKGSKAAPISSKTCGEFQITIPQDYRGVLVFQCINTRTYEIDLAKLKDRRDCIISLSDIRKFENKECPKSYKKARRITI
jgi:hypothetical protein